MYSVRKNTIQPVANYRGLIATVVVTVATLLNPAEILAQGAPHNIDTRYMGMNFAGAGDNVRYPMLANVAKCGRISQLSSPSTPDNSILDIVGDPTQDFAFWVFDTNYGTIGTHGGTYQISFNGMATVTGIGGSLYGPITTTYAAETNTSTASFTLPANPTHPVLSFTATKRDAVSTANTGIANLKIMRPVSPGSATSFSPSTVFTTQFINVVQNFQCYRNISNIWAGGNDWETSWSMRMLPGFPGISRDEIPGTERLEGNEGRGFAHELTVKLANDADVDILISIPVCADDDYITNLANLIHYGSDGTTPYTSTQTSPEWPGLESGRKVYLELGNELWNWAWPYYYGKAWLHAAAKATPENHVIRYDGTNNENVLAYRWQAYRTMQISNLFRSVWGDVHMHTVVRPLLSWQLGGGDDTHALMFLHNYYNNGDDVAHVAQPHPVNYYIWGGSGTFYQSWENTPDPYSSHPASVDALYTNLNAQSYVSKYVAPEIAWAKTMGLAAFSYEGGLALGGDSGGALYNAAWADARAGTATISLWNALEDGGLDGGCWLNTCGNDPSANVGTGVTWEYVRNFWNPTEGSPKMQGIDTLNNTTVRRVPTIGVETGAAGFLAAEYIDNKGWQSHSRSASSIILNKASKAGTGYLVRSNVAGTHNIRLRHSGNATRVGVIVNGWNAGNITLPATSAAAWSTNLPVTLGTGLNGIRLVSRDNSVTLWSLAVEDGDSILSSVWDTAQLPSGQREGWINDFVGWVFFEATYAPWTWSSELQSWVYPWNGQRGDSFWIWVPDVGWMYTGAPLYPYMYYAGKGTWLSHHKGSDNFTFLSDSAVVKLALLPNHP